MKLSKSILVSLLSMLIVSGIMAQSPQMFNYQAVIRNEAGQVISSEGVIIEITLLQGGADGNQIFSETHNTHTNEFGLINLQIGSVNSISEIDWNQGDIYISISVDGTLMGVTQLLSVPFAMHSGSSADAFSGNYNELFNTPDLSNFIHASAQQNGDMLFFDGQQWMIISIGLEGQVLTVIEGLPQWADLPQGGDDDPEPDTVTDIDGNVYPTIRIGKQNWMAKNLMTTRFADGSDIPTGLSNDQWNGGPGAYAIYDYQLVDGINSQQEMQQIYGNLYNWFAASDERGICPVGWRVPAISDWDILKDSLIYYNDFINLDNIGNSLKSCRQVNSPLGEECVTEQHPRWDAHHNQYGFDSFGFNAVPSGFRGWAGPYSSIGVYGVFWSATSGSTTSAWTFRVLYSGGYVENSNQTKKTGYSVRCIQNE